MSIILMTLFLSSCFNSKKLICTQLGLYPDHVLNCTTASVKGTCVGYAHTNTHNYIHFADQFLFFFYKILILYQLQNIDLL